MSPRRFTLLLCGCYVAAGASLAQVIDGPVGRDAERGDPARWYEPAQTPQQQYDNAMKEARAALAEALRACRANGSRSGRADPGEGSRGEGTAARQSCEAEARDQYEWDVERARGFMVRSNLG